LQSFPTVYAFFQGQVVDGFAGGQSEAHLQEWIKALIKQTGSKAEAAEGEDAASALLQAEEHFANGDYYTAKAIYTDILDYAPDELRAHAGVMRCLIAEGQSDEAAGLLAALPDKKARNTAFDPIRAALELQGETGKITSDTQELEGKVAANADDHAARYDLALAYYAAGDHEKAINSLLEIVARNRSWQDDAARKQLVKVFDVLGPTDPLTVSSRKRLSSILFS
jgi:putative thioredoxin